MCVSKENAELLEGDLGGEKKRGGMQGDSGFKKGLSAEIKRGEIPSDLRHAET